MTVLKTKVSLLKCSTSDIKQQKTSGKAPESLEDSSLSENDEETLKFLNNIVKITQVFQKLNVIKMKL